LNNSNRILAIDDSIDFGKNLLEKINISATLIECSKEENTTISNLSIT